MSAATEVPPMAAARVYITIEEAARLVSVDEKTIGRWSREDPTFPVLRRRRVVRVHKERFLTWLERQTRQRGARKAQVPAGAA